MLPFSFSLKDSKPSQSKKGRRALGGLTSGFVGRFCGGFLGLAAEKQEACTTTTERISFGELFWPQRKTFQASGGYKNPIKRKKAITTTEIFPPWPPFFSGKEKFCTGAGRCMLSFSQWLVDFGGVVRRQIYCFRLADFPAEFFRWIFLLHFVTKKSTTKSTENSTNEVAANWKIFHRRLKPRPAMSKLQVQHWYPPWNWNQVCLPNFSTSKELLEHGNRSSENPKTRGFKPHRPIGQGIAHSKARWQAEIYTSKKKDGTTKLIAKIVSAKMAA